MPSPDEPGPVRADTSAPHWAFSPDHDIRCPDCGAKVSGLNWIMATVEMEDKATGMSLVPCGHELPMDVWELSFSGRDRRLGTVIRTPKFQRLDGS
jgi:hypothetical protein